MSSIMGKAELTAIITARDLTKQATESARRNIEGVGKAAEQASRRVSSLGQSVESGISTMRALTAAGLGLMTAMQRVQSVQLRVERQQLSLQRATTQLAAAQKAYNDAVKRYGEDSEQARLALMKLRDAQENVRIQTLALEEAQQEVNDAILDTALLVIPSLTTSIIKEAPKLARAFRDLGLKASMAFRSGLLGGRVLGAGLVLGLIGAVLHERLRLEERMREELKGMEMPEAAKEFLRTPLGGIVPGIRARGMSMGLGLGLGQGRSGPKSSGKEVERALSINIYGDMNFRSPKEASEFLEELAGDFINRP